MTDVVAALSCRPAGVLGLEKGTLSLGAAADISIFDPKQIWEVTSETLESLSSNSPWLGMKLSGRVTHLFVAGKIVREPTAG